MAETFVRPSEVRWARRLVTAAGLTFYLLASLALVYSAAGVYLFLSSGGARTDLVLSIASTLLAGCYFTIGYYLRRFRIWARNFAFAFAGVSLLAFPVGTILGALVILSIERGNRALLFETPPRAVEQPAAVVEEDAPILRFEPAAAPAGAELISGEAV